MGNTLCFGGNPAAGTDGAEDQAAPEAQSAVTQQLDEGQSSSGCFGHAYKGKGILPCFGGNPAAGTDHGAEDQTAPEAQSAVTQQLDEGQSSSGILPCFGAQKEDGKGKAKLEEGQSSSGCFGHAYKGKGILPCFGGRKNDGKGKDKLEEEDKLEEDKLEEDKPSDINSGNDGPEGQIAGNQQLEEGQSSTAINTATRFDINGMGITNQTIMSVGLFHPVTKGILENQKEVMLKHIKIAGNAQDFQDDIDRVWPLRHPNLVELKGYYDGPSFKAVVYEFTSFRSVESYIGGTIEDRRALTWNTRMNIAFGVAKGLNFLHTKGYFYGCLKSSNVLLDKQLHPKIVDLGLWKWYDKLNEEGHSEYYPIEFSETRNPTPMGDIYCFGIILLELISACTSEYIVGDYGFINRVRDWLAQAPQTSSTSSLPYIVDTEMNKDITKDKLRKVIQLAVNCVEIDPVNRPEMNFVLQVLTGEINSGAAPGEASSSGTVGEASSS